MSNMLRDSDLVDLTNNVDVIAETLREIAEEMGRMSRVAAYAALLADGTPEDANNARAALRRLIGW